MEKKMETAIDTTRGFRAIVKDISAWKRNITKRQPFLRRIRAQSNTQQRTAFIDDMCLCF